MLAHLLCDKELCSDAIGCRYKYWIYEASTFKIKKCSKAANFDIGSGSSG
jgi:hypothetical protein